MKIPVTKKQQVRTSMNLKKNVTKTEIDSLNNYSVREINEDHFKNKKLHELPISSEQIEIFNDHVQFQDKLYFKLLFSESNSYAFFNDSVVQIKKN